MDNFDISFFSRTTRPIKTKLSTKSWGKGDKSSINKGAILVPREHIMTVKTYTCNNWTQYLPLKKYPSFVNLKHNCQNGSEDEDFHKLSMYFIISGNKCSYI